VASEVDCDVAAGLSLKRRDWRTSRKTRLFSQVAFCSGRVVDTTPFPTENNQCPRLRVRGSVIGSWVIPGANPLMNVVSGTPLPLNGHRYTVSLWPKNGG
jgi:hypothetical protein